MCSSDRKGCIANKIIGDIASKADKWQNFICFGGFALIHIVLGIGNIFLTQ